MEEQILKTLYELLAIDAPSGEEGQLADLLVKKLLELGLKTEKDKAGNVIGFLPGKGEPLLLTAHMDRVPPGKGLTPVREGNILKTDGTTNLGTDDAAGIVIILEAIRSILAEKVSHTPFIVVFTVKEEIGLQGARALDLSQYGVKQGIGYDNAFEAGVLIGSGSTYEGFDVEITGKPTHPGKDLSLGINALKIFQEIDWMIGISDNGATRINVGLITGGTARNVVPGSIKIQGELRSTLPDEGVLHRLKELEDHIKVVCDQYSASYSFSTHRHSSSYTVDPNEPLVQIYKQVLQARGAELVIKPTFVGSDANALRAEKGINVFTLATGVMNEHTKDEWVKISDLVQLTKDLVEVIKKLGK